MRKMSRLLFMACLTEGDLNPHHVAWYPSEPLSLVPPLPEGHFILLPNGWLVKQRIHLGKSLYHPDCSRKHAAL
jgi:hypothetical protein